MFILKLLYLVFLKQSSEISDIKKFRWVDRIRFAIIKNIDVNRSILINRIYGDWLNIWYELTINSGLKPGYDKMIGNVSV